MNTTVTFQRNLLLPATLEPTAQDVADLVLLNSIAPGNDLAFSIYSFKDFLLKGYGVPDGYDRQLFCKYAWGEYCERGRIDFCQCETKCQIWTSHIHYLERRILGGHLFHIPTNIFKVGNAYNITIRSEGSPPPFKNTIYGRKKPQAGVVKNEIYLAAMRVTLRYGCYFNTQAFKYYLRGA